MTARIPVTALAGLLVLPGLSAKQATLPKSLRALRIRTALILDGSLSEPVWSEAETAQGFTAEWPLRGEPAKQKTDVKVLYDDRFVYIGARMHHDPALEGGVARIIRRLHRRDQDSQGDWFGVAIDSLHDGRTAFLFEVNAAGVQRDQVVFQDTSFDSTWDGVWESEVKVDELGWTAELRIPLSLLRLHKDGGERTWGINFNRSDQGPVREFTRWHMVPRGENAFVSRFPLLEGIEGLEPRPRREFLPFLSVAQKFETAQPFDDRGTEVKGGLDARLGLTSSSQLDLSLRPDFGQVEVDQVVLNLSTFETFFPEKRPFFLEGAEIFRTIGPTLFHSRRIGRGLQAPELAEGETLVDRPLAADIAAAAKYTVKTSGGFNIGLLGAGVEAERATIRLASGDEVRREISPYTTYGVLRAQKQMDARGSFLGGFASIVRQSGASGREAFVGALDGVYKSQDRSVGLDFALVRSEAGEKDGAAQEGWFGRLSGTKAWKNGWFAQTTVISMGRDFRINDLGFRGRSDEKFIFSRVSKNWDRTWRSLRNWNASLEVGENQDQRGLAFNRFVNLRGSTDFTNYWSTWLGVGRDFATWDDRELRTFADPVKKYLRRDAAPFIYGGFDTAGNKPWYLRFEVDHTRREGGPLSALGLFQTIKPTPALEFQLHSRFRREHGERSYFETQETTPVTGLRRLSLFDQVLRVSYAFNPRLTVQLFSQWLAVNYAHRDLRSYVDDRTSRPVASDSPRDHSFRAWNVNLISRWEFRPGSTAFLVYTHGAATDQLISQGGGLRPLADLGKLSSLPSDDVVQVKVSWLFR